MIKQGKRSEFEKLLEYLREKCEKTVIVLSSSSAIDSTQNTLYMQKDQLTGVIQSSGYKIVTLDKVMRNTSSIANSVSAGSWSSYNKSGHKITPTIPSGYSSTVTGHKPTAILYKPRDGKMGKYVATITDYRLLGRCVKRYLDGNLQIRDTRLTILCDKRISVGKLKPDIISLFPDMKCYDAGIEEFDEYSMPVYSDITDYDYSDEDTVINWLEEGGTLLTHANLFRGCEAESVIVVSRDWAGSVTNDTPRSSATRGVANLCIISGNNELNPKSMKKHFNVIEYSEDQT